MAMTLAHQRSIFRVQKPRYRLLFRLKVKTVRFLSKFLNFISSPVSLKGPIDIPCSKIVIFTFGSLSYSTESLELQCISPFKKLFDTEVLPIYTQDALLCTITSVYKLSLSKTFRTNLHRQHSYVLLQYYSALK